MDSSKVRGRIKALQGERDVALEAEATLMKKLQIAQALEAARLSKLSAMERRVQLGEEDASNQEERLTKLQRKVEQTAQKLDEVEQQWRSLQAEEFFRKTKQARQLLPQAAGASGRPGSSSHGLKERLESTQTEVCDGHDELARLHRHVDSLEGKLAEMEEREREINDRNRQLATESASLSDDVETKRRSRLTIAVTEEKLQQRVNQCEEKLERQKARRANGVAELSRLEETYEAGIEECSTWEERYFSAAQELEKAREDIGELINM